MKTSNSVARIKKTYKAPRIGYILHETEDIVAIATLKTRNGKTGNMVQVWIMLRNISPIDAVKNGMDRIICFDCPNRSEFGFSGRICYVEIGRAPQGIWLAYQRGRYEHLAPSDYARVFGSRKVRWGAYGEPVLIPVEMMAAISSVSKGWTGYTHQWRRAEFQVYKHYLMASCDSAKDAQDALAMGWRYFRVRSKSDPIMKGEVSCPSADEAGKKSNCAKCQLCNGMKDNDPRKSITLIVHGKGAQNFVSLDSIRPAA